MTKTIFAVSSGSYSDYGVSVVCATRALATAVAERMNVGSPTSYYEVEEFAYVDEPFGDAVIYYVAHANIRAIGGTDLREWSNTLQPWDERYEEAVKGFRPKVEVHAEGQTGTYLRVEGTDQAQVRKAFYDRRAQILAEKYGITG